MEGRLRIIRGGIFDRLLSRICCGWEVSWVSERSGRRGVEWLGSVWRLRWVGWMVLE